MILERLMPGPLVATFMERHFLQTPFAMPGGCREFVSNGTWQTLEGLLAQPDVDVIVGREGEQAADGVPSIEQSRDYVERGYTVGVRHAHLHDPILARLARDFQGAFHAPVDIHLYCTPANSPGFGWHYDAEDVFVLQTVGSKEWELRKNTVNPWPLIETLPANMRYEREIMPLSRCKLDTGDWLYIPAGYWHRTRAGAESISLSIGLRTPTAMDLFDFMRTQLLGSLRWRQRLPTTGAAARQSREELLAVYQSLLDELAEDLGMQMRDATFARAVIDRH